MIVGELDEAIVERDGISDMINDWGGEMIREEEVSFDEFGKDGI